MEAGHEKSNAHHVPPSNELVVVLGQGCGTGLLPVSQVMLDFSYARLNDFTGVLADVMQTEHCLRFAARINVSVVV